MDTTSTEVSVVENIFKLNEIKMDRETNSDMRKDLVKTLEWEFCWIL